MNSTAPERDEVPAVRIAVTWLAATWHVVRKHPIWFTLCALAGAIGGTVVAFVIPSQYTTSAAFIAQAPQSGNIPSSLAAIAGAIGFTTGQSFSPQFYADLITSRPILKSVVWHKYAIPQGDSTSLVNYAEIVGYRTADTALAESDAIKTLARHVSVTADVRTNVVTLSISTRYARLSQQIALQFLTALDSLNIAVQQAQSRQLQVFYEARMSSIGTEVQTAEDNVRDFLQRNRIINTPGLQFELQRLERKADIMRQVYGSVAQQYEAARIEAVRDVPTISVLASPYVPAKKSFPPRRLIAALGLLTGLAAAWSLLAFRSHAADPLLRASSVQTGTH